MSSMSASLNAPMLTALPELDPFPRAAPLKVDSRAVSSTLTDHQITCTIPTTYWGVNFFILKDGEVLSHWNDGLNGATWTGTTWVKMPVIYPSTINELDIIDHMGFFDDISSADDTLILYDDFNSASFDTDKWNQTGTITKSQSGGILSITAATRSALLYGANAVCGPGTEVLAYFKAGAASSTSYPYSLVGFMRSDLSHRVMFGSESGVDDACAYTHNGTATKTENIAWTNASYHTVKVRWVSGTATYISDGSTKATHTTNVPSTSDLYVGFYRQRYGGNIYCNYIYAYKYDANTPSGVLG